jgi:hypothetical protein
VSLAHVVLHDVASAQTKPPAQAAGVAAPQLPDPSHVLGVSVLPVQDEPQAVPEVGYPQAPAPSHAVAPHVGLAVLHAAAQQLPLPSTSHTPDAHSLLAVQAAPLPAFGTHTPEAPGFMQ